MRWKCSALLAATLLAAAGGAGASDAAGTYPARPVRWVVPFTPGASNDMIARLVGQKLTEACAKRSPLLPDVPTLAESGIKDAEAIVWFGMSGPPKLPRAIVDRLNAQVNNTLALADVKQRLDSLGLEIAGGKPEEFDAFVKKEAAKVSRLVKADLLKVE